MQKNVFFILLALVSLIFINTRDTRSQSPSADGHRFEVGGQVSVLSNSVVNAFDGTVVPCINPPCPFLLSGLSKSRKTQPGFGGRFGYNLTDNLALEAELNVFPKADSFSGPAAFNNGNFIHGLFGLKAGKRFEQVGIFGKARPGFLYASKGALQDKPGTVCAAVFPPPTGCSQTTSKNSFALDVGGVVEVYPTKRTVIRFDVGDTIVRMDKRNVTAVLISRFGTSDLGVIPVAAETTHNFQGSIGIGFRF